MAKRGCAGRLPAVMLLAIVAAPAMARDGPGRHYTALAAPDPALMRAGAALGVSIGIEAEDAATLGALYRHQVAVAALLRDALAGRVAPGGVAMRDGAVLVGGAGRGGVLALAEGPLLVVVPAMAEPGATSPARLLLRAVPAPR